MEIIEISRKYCRDYYNGNYAEAVKKRDGVIFDSNSKSHREYIKRNKQFCKYFKLPEGVQI